jgi:hypothetical protein
VPCAGPCSIVAAITEMSSFPDVASYRNGCLALPAGLSGGHQRLHVRTYTRQVASSFILATTGPCYLELCSKLLLPISSSHPGLSSSCAFCTQDPQFLSPCGTDLFSPSSSSKENLHPLHISTSSRSLRLLAPGLLSSWILFSSCYFCL